MTCCIQALYNMPVLSSPCDGCQETSMVHQVVSLLNFLCSVSLDQLCVARPLIFLKQVLSVLAQEFVCSVFCLHN